jgi:hypothetical protein
VAGGWEFAGVFSGRSGLPFTPAVSSDVANTGVTTETPNRIGSGKLAKRSATLWFNPAAFQAPTPNTYSPYFTRNILAADGLVDFDATVKKNIMWTAERGMELRSSCGQNFLLISRYS